MHRVPWLGRAAPSRVELPQLGELALDHLVLGGFDVAADLLRLDPSGFVEVLLERLGASAPERLPRLGCRLARLLFGDSLRLGGDAKLVAEPVPFRAGCRQVEPSHAASLRVAPEPVPPALRLVVGDAGVVHGGQVPHPGAYIYVGPVSYTHLRAHETPEHL